MRVFMEIDNTLYEHVKGEIDIVDCNECDLCNTSYCTKFCLSRGNHTHCNYVNPEGGGYWKEVKV